MATKFRPYFSAPELAEIISALKENPRPKRIPIIRYLEEFAGKITAGLRAPAIETQAPLLERLELVPSSKLPKPDGETLYNFWRTSPNLCTPADLEIVNQYRYENDLMPSDEEIEYEKANRVV